NAHLPAAYKQTIHDLVLQHCRYRPNAPALSSRDRQLIFQELDDLSAELAQHLVGMGVRLGVLVSVCFEKSIWPVVAMLAVLRAGGACVNIDPSLPPGRIREMLQEVQSTIIVASHAKKELIENSAPFAVTVITIPLIMRP